MPNTLAKVISVSIPPELLDRLDEHSLHLSRGNRSKAICLLITEALDSHDIQRGKETREQPPRTMAGERIIEGEDAQL
jgi:metal-responsive CopG/Arc/MetJ family transcriptional regulator